MEAIAFADGTRQTTAHPSPLWNAIPLRETHDRAYLNGNGVTVGASGQLQAWALPLFEGDYISRMAMMSGGTALGVPTNWWFALYDDGFQLLTQTNDQLTAALNTLTIADLAFQVPQRIPKNGIYYACTMFAATTPPTFQGQVGIDAGLANGPIANSLRKRSFRANSGLTGTAPQVLTFASNALGMGYVALY